MISVKRYYPIALLCAVLLTGASSALAVDDGLGYGDKVEGTYITAYYDSGLNTASLAQQLNIRPSDKIMTGQSLKAAGSGEGELAQMLDTLFLQVSDVLDMHVYSLKITIKICKTNEELNEVYNRLFGANLGGRRSFYVYDLNSIYVSADVFQPGIIGHEMSHAIISRYFGVPAPIKLQEVLAMYVEYNLRHTDRQ